MLKLEKVAKTLEINITLRPRTTFLTKNFKEAFLIALTLHFITALLFTIQLIKITEGSSTFSPVYVESELLTALNNQVVAELDSDDIFSRYVGEPREARPEWPVYSNTQTSFNSLTYSMEPATENPFLSIEYGILNPLLPLPTSPATLSLNPVKIEYFAGLNKYSIIDEGWRNIDFTSLKKMAASGYKIAYNIRLDLQTGSIFWFESLHNKHNKYHLLAEKILKEIQFDVADSTDAIASGIIEITFYKIAGD